MIGMIGSSRELVQIAVHLAGLSRSVTRKNAKRLSLASKNLLACTRCAHAIKTDNTLTSRVAIIVDFYLENRKGTRRRIGQTIRTQSNVKRKCQRKEENVCKWARFDAGDSSDRTFLT